MAESALKRRLAQVVDVLTYPSRKVDEWTYNKLEPYLGDNPKQAYDSLGQMVDAAGIIGSISNVGAKGAKAAAKALDMSKEARMARAKEMGFDVDNPVFHGTTPTRVNPIKEGIEEFKLPKEISKEVSGSGNAVFFTRDPEFAGNYASRDDGGSVYKTFLKAKKTFDPEDSNQVKELFGVLSNKKLWDSPETQKRILDKWSSELSLSNKLKGVDPEDLDIAKRQFSNWHILEDKKVLDAIKELGYDSMKVFEQGTPNIAVFDPKNIRSVNAAFDPAKASSKNILAGAAGAGIIGSQAKEAMDRRLSK